LTKRIDLYGSHYDWMVEQVDKLKRIAHFDGECKGPPECAWCLNELEVNNENEDF